MDRFHRLNQVCSDVQCYIRDDNYTAAYVVPYGDGVPSTLFIGYNEEDYSHRRYSRYRVQPYEEIPYESEYSENTRRIANCVRTSRQAVACGPRINHAGDLLMMFESDPDSVWEHAHDIVARSIVEWGAQYNKSMATLNGEVPPVSGRPRMADGSDILMLPPQKAPAFKLVEELRVYAILQAFAEYVIGGPGNPLRVISSPIQPDALDRLRRDDAVRIGLLDYDPNGLLYSPPLRRVPPPVWCVNTDELTWQTAISSSFSSYWTYCGYKHVDHNLFEAGMFAYIYVHHLVKEMAKLVYGSHSNSQLATKLIPDNTLEALPPNWIDERDPGDIDKKHIGYAHVVNAILSIISEPHDIINFTGDGDCLWSAIYAATVPELDVHGCRADMLEYISNLKRSVYKTFVTDSATFFNFNEAEGVARLSDTVEIDGSIVASAGYSVGNAVSTYFNQVFATGDEYPAMIVLTMVVNRHNQLCCSKYVIEMINLLNRTRVPSRPLPIVVISNGRHAMALRFRDAGVRPLPFHFIENADLRNVRRDRTLPYVPKLLAEDAQVASILYVRSAENRISTYTRTLRWLNELYRNDIDLAVKYRETKHVLDYATYMTPYYITHGSDIRLLLNRYPLYVPPAMLVGEKPLGILVALANRIACMHIVNNRGLYHANPNVIAVSKSTQLDGQHFYTMPGAMGPDEGAPDDPHVLKDLVIKVHNIVAKYVVDAGLYVGDDAFADGGVELRGACGMSSLCGLLSIIMGGLLGSITVA